MSKKPFTKLTHFEVHEGSKTTNIFPHELKASSHDYTGMVSEIRSKSWGTIKPRFARIARKGSA